MPQRNVRKPVRKHQVPKIDNPHGTERVRRRRNRAADARVGTCICKTKVQILGVTEINYGLEKTVNKHVLQKLILQKSQFFISRAATNNTAITAILS